MQQSNGAVPVSSSSDKNVLVEKVQLVSCEEEPDAEIKSKHIVVTLGLGEKKETSILMEHEIQEEKSSEGDFNEPPVKQAKTERETMDADMERPFENSKSKPAATEPVSQHAQGETSAAGCSRGIES